jgi:2-dehydropantoate 2-reductase
VHFAILGSGAVGGYYGAKLAQAGHRVTFLARGAHLRAIRERGLVVWSPAGDFTVHAAAESDPAQVGTVDVVVLAVKTYDNEAALPMLRPLIGEGTMVLTLQNGVDSINDTAAVAGRGPVLGGATYVATALKLPGIIEQTGTHRRIVFGEVFGDLPRLSERVQRLREVLAGADIEAEAVGDARVPLWEKFIFLAPFAGFTGAARLPIGPIWAESVTRERFLAAVGEVEAVARAAGIDVPGGMRERIERYTEALPPSTRSSLLIDLALGKRIEVEALQGSVDRRARQAGVPAPIMATLYALLKPWEKGTLNSFGTAPP